MNNELESLNNYWVWFTDENDEENTFPELYYGFSNEESVANHALANHALVDNTQNFRYIHVVNKKDVKIFQLGLKAV